MEQVKQKLKAGIIGCGVISDTYFKNVSHYQSLEIIACADLDVDRAKQKAETYGVSKAYSVEDMLADTGIDMIINLTIPAAHAEVSIASLEAGKHVYVEKPLAVSLEDAKKMLDVADERQLFIGGAPDTFLGGGLQTCRKLIDEGVIGKAVAASAFMMNHGHESWHPNPDFYYQEGGGPMFDMGPYYLSALVSLIGPVKRVTGSTSTSFLERETKNGRKFPVKVPTHISGVMDFENGAVGTIITSFDIWGANVPFIEIYGETGTVSVPDPNTFGGPVKLKKAGEKEWREVPLTHPYTDNCRGIGAADMAEAILNGTNHRASGGLMYHVLEIMHGFHISSNQGQHYHLARLNKRPAALKEDKHF
ncbi:Gfo/Idh/MocA family protein [Fictibacillus phosphorivorans]|uniref:Gfo/Idh/MocA family protein n=1 Tax=Fictibacillus phosphorivorans TaxID=1221500 RepID=UPI0020421296|nr:Gfo/Idh/MocA family oxidoreductase [Fictibacillus phosphorivorans]MCM3717787.1 Gfo/Idh/MocA family oxidoreductase [Fictibacillus phosphorivorans]MCM3777015.1 Gfo/Idh/MocA family oxidoreductase [Fictibacillus phosphorivorans]